ncbi:MAG TPA: hypothetical protein VN950_01710 [Terriglobales bacterium]|nr:hypothetical protein [Terriglobales bacterium]
MAIACRARSRRLPGQFYGYPESRAALIISYYTNRSLNWEITMHLLREFTHFDPLRLADPSRNQSLPRLYNLLTP